MTLNEGYNSNAMIQFMRNGFVFYALDGMVSNFCIEKKNFQRGVNKSTREIGWANFSKKLLLPIFSKLDGHYFMLASVF